MDENIFEFLLESQSIMFELDRLVDKYGLRDKVLSCNVQGVLLPDPEDESADRLYSVYKSQGNGTREHGKKVRSRLQHLSTQCHH